MNNDLISRRWLLERMRKVAATTYEDYEVRELIEAAPAIDPVHVTGEYYCWECKFWDRDKGCTLFNVWSCAEDFCSFGVLKGGDT